MEVLGALVLLTINHVLFLGWQAALFVLLGVLRGRVGVGWLKEVLAMRCWGPV